MRAYVIEGPDEGRVGDVEDPMPGPGEVLVRVGACGICGTDLHIFRGEFPAEYPVIPGHEFSGEVVSVGAGVSTVKIGDRVAVNPNIACGKCYYCKRGAVHFCENWAAIGIHRNGACAEYVPVPEQNVHKIPEKLSFEEAAFAEPVACCLHGQDLLDLRHGNTVAIFGLGPIGLIHAQLARHSGASVIIGVDIIRDRVERGKRVGLDYALNAKEVDVVGEVRRLTGGRGVDRVIEASGSPAALRQAVEIAGHGSRILVFGVAPPEEAVQVRPFEIYRKEIAIMGSFINPFTTGRAVQVLASGTVRIDPLVSHRICIDDIPAYYDKLLKKEEGILKVLVIPSR